MQDVEFTNGLLTFIENSPTPFHAVENMVSILRENDFEALNESDEWQEKNQTRERRADGAILCHQK